MDAGGAGGARGNDGPVENPPFAHFTTWRVFNETYCPSHIVTINWTGTAVSGPEDFEVQPSQSLSLSASIRGRVRSGQVGVTRAVLDSVSSDRTFQTPAWRNPIRFAGWSILWLASFVGAWFALGSMSMFVYIFLFVLCCIVPPLLSRSIVDFAWWAGRGVANEFRVRWIITGALWVLAVLTLVELQIRVR